MSLIDPDSLSISDDVQSNDGRIDPEGVTFFALSILYSMCTLLFSILNVVNTAKGGQLSLSQKACLGLVYFLQLGKMSKTFRKGGGGLPRFYSKFS